MSETPGLIEAFRNILGGAGVTLVASTLGRLMWHTNEVRARRRKFFGHELLWELPTALGMGLVGEGLSSYYQLDELATVGVIVTLSYLGPRGVEAIYQGVKGRSSPARPPAPHAPDPRPDMGEHSDK